jgi:hypothetical protein
MDGCTGETAGMDGYLGRTISMCVHLYLSLCRASGFLNVFDDTNTIFGYI